MLNFTRGQKLTQAEKRVFKVPENRPIRQKKNSKIRKRKRKNKVWGDMGQRERKTEETKPSGERRIHMSMQVRSAKGAGRKMEQEGIETEVN